MKTYPRGQGMLEMLVAISMLIVGVMSVITLTVRILNASGDAGARFTASQLAREAIDVTRSLRDGNWYAAESWNTGFSDAGDRTAILVWNPVGRWELNFAPDAITDDVARVYTDDDGFFGQDETLPNGAQVTGFRRLITLDPLCLDPASSDDPTVQTGGACPANQDEVGVRVTVAVSWSVSGRAQNISVMEELYDWR